MDLLGFAGSMLGSLDLDSLGDLLDDGGLAAGAIVGARRLCVRCALEGVGSRCKSGRHSHTRRGLPPAKHDDGDGLGRE